MKKALCLVTFICSSMFAIAQRVTPRGSEMFGLASKDEVEKSLAIGLPLLALTIILIYVAPRFKSDKIGCLIGLLLVATFFALLPVLFYVEVFGPIVLFGGAIIYAIIRGKKKK